MHAETVAGDRHAVRWVLPGSSLPSGRLREAPGALGALLAAGTLQEVRTEPHGVTMRLAEGRTWRDEGDPVRAALAAALDEVGAWVVEPDEDGTLVRVAQDVLAGPVGDYVRSHGGLVTVTGAHDGILALVFDGACSGCPASGVTLHSRIESAVRERYPAVREVRDTSAGRPARSVTLWPRLRRP